MHDLHGRELCVSSASSAAGAVRAVYAAHGRRVLRLRTAASQRFRDVLGRRFRYVLEQHVQHVRHNTSLVSVVQELPCGTAPLFMEMLPRFHFLAETLLGSIASSTLPASGAPPGRSALVHFLVPACLPASKFLEVLTPAQRASVRLERWRPDALHEARTVFYTGEVRHTRHTRLTYASRATGSAQRKRRERAS